MGVGRKTVRLCLLAIGERTPRRLASANAACCR
jgi:hypothetical protein